MVVIKGKALMFALSLGRPLLEKMLGSGAQSMKIMALFLRIILLVLVQLKIVLEPVMLMERLLATTVCRNAKITGLGPKA